MENCPTDRKASTIQAGNVGILELREQNLPE